MTEGKLARVVLFSIGIIVILFVLSELVMRALLPTLLQSHEELNGFLRLLLAGASMLRTYVIYLSIAVLCLWGILFWVLMLIDALTRVFVQPTDRIVWVLVVVLLNLPGALLYYYRVKRAAVER